MPTCSARPARIAQSRVGAEPEQEGQAELDQERPEVNTLMTSGILRQRVEAEPADLGVVQDVVQRRAVQPGRAVALSMAVSK